MTIHAIIKKGKVIPTEPLPFAEGTEVVIRASARREKATRRSNGPSTTLLKFAGAASNLPTDLSTNHDQPVPFADGTEVTIRLCSNGRKSPAQQRKGSKPEALSQMLLRHAGTIKGMPRDWARNHDHYLYGVPKKKR